MKSYRERRLFRELLLRFSPVVAQKCTNPEIYNRLQSSRLCQNACLLRDGRAAIQLCETKVHFGTCVVYMASLCGMKQFGVSLSQPIAGLTLSSLSQYPFMLGDRDNVEKRFLFKETTRQCRDHTRLTLPTSHLPMERLRLLTLRSLRVLMICN